MTGVQLALPAPGMPRSTAERFEAFHLAHPEVYATLRRLALEAKAKDKRVGIRLLWEVMRWHHLVEVDDGSGFALNNNLPPYYSRRLMERERELRDFFETRDRE